MTKDQLITDRYALYNSDSHYVLSSLPDNSIDLSMYSPPFQKEHGSALYNYSSSPNDLSNCESLEQFNRQYGAMIEQLSRIHKRGTISAVHCTDVMDSKTENLFDFPHEIISLYRKHGFDFKCRIFIWKEPLKVRMRTMVRSLMHKMIVEDSSNCFPAQGDMILVFKKRGEREIPVTHPFGLKHYAGEYPFLIAHLERYGLPGDIRPIYNSESNAYSMTDGVENYIKMSFEELKKKYEGWEDQSTNKLSHIIWQRYASIFWDDIRIDNVLPFRDAKEDDDEKHVHPLQLDVYDRCVELWSNPGDKVLEPFLGCGGGVYSAVSMGRYGIGIELKDSYYNQSVLNLREVDKRFKKEEQYSLFA